MKNKIKKFYLNNYRIIHHTINIVFLVLFLKLFIGNIWEAPILLVLFYLFASYKITEFIFNYLDFHEDVKKELEKIDKDIED